MFNSQEKSVTTLQSAEFGKLRTLTKPNEQVWFALVDVCKALEIGNPRDVRRRLHTPGVDTIDVGVVTGTRKDGSPATQQTKLTFINEPNLYRCIFQSRKAEAVRFQDWVFEVVLPSLRRGGHVPAEPQAIGGISPLYTEGAWLYPLRALTLAVGYGQKASERWTKRAMGETRLIGGRRYATARLAQLIERTATARRAIAEAQSLFAGDLFPQVEEGGRHE